MKWQKGLRRATWISARPASPECSLARSLDHFGYRNDPDPHPRRQIEADSGRRQHVPS